MLPKVVRLVLLSELSDPQLKPPLKPVQVVLQAGRQPLQGGTVEGLAQGWVREAIANPSCFQGTVDSI